MLPLKDDNPKNIRPYVTVSLIVACVAVFLWQVSLPPEAARRAIIALGAIPTVVFQQADLPRHLAYLPGSLDVPTLVTSAFLHGGWMHLGGNMLYLWIFGDNVEDAMGHVRFIAFYVICAIASALIHAIPDPSSTSPLVGASGAISGVLGAYLLLYPRARVLIWAFSFFVFWLPAWIVLGFWFALQIFYLGTAGDSNVAWWAHIGGMMVGMALIPLFKYRHVGLFGSGHLSQTAEPRED